MTLALGWFLSATLFEAWMYRGERWEAVSLFSLLPQSALESAHLFELTR